LTDNDEYLAYALSLARDNAGAAAAARKVRFWMTVNSNWRNRCDKISFENGVRAHLDNDGTVSKLQPRESIGRVVMFNDDGPRAVVVSFREGGSRLSATVPVSCIFTSPMIATRLGLVEIVKTLIDNGFLGVNAFLPLRGHASRPEQHISIICSCLRNESVDNSVLRYLLSRDDFDPNIPWNLDDPQSKPVHVASCSPFSDPETLQMLLDHPNCSADDVAESGRTPLHLLCRHTMDKKHAVAKMKILLAAGGNPELQDASGDTPLDHLIRRFRSARTDEDIDLAAELLVTLQKATVARIAQQEPT